MNRLGEATIAVLVLGIPFGGVATIPTPTLVGMLETQGYPTPLAQTSAFFFYLTWILLFAMGIATMFSERKSGQSLWRAFRNRPLRALFGIPLIFGMLYSSAAVGLAFGGVAFKANILTLKWWFGIVALASGTLFVIWMTDVSYEIVYGERSEQELADAI